ncbi:hypothetical protein JHK82_024398 [Glycine max]|nr:hypothetical protein JHK82_024398 [Glycine max]
MVRELGLAVRIRVDYRVDGNLVRAEEVENDVRLLMKGCDEIRKKVKETSDKCRVALIENGSSYNNLISMIQELTSASSMEKQRGPRDYFQTLIDDYETRQYSLRVHRHVSRRATRCCY